MKLNLEELENSHNKTMCVEFSDKLDDINSNGVIDARLEFKSLGEFIEVRGEVCGKIILECDRCLEEFEYALDFFLEELFAKEALIEESPQETELKSGEFVVDLRGAKDIDICDLLYQSVILNLPNKQVCGINCKGDNFLKEDEITDPRLDVFKNINIEKRK